MTPISANELTPRKWASVGRLRCALVASLAAASLPSAVATAQSPLTPVVTSVQTSLPEARSYPSATPPAAAPYSAAPSAATYSATPTPAAAWDTQYRQQDFTVPQTRMVPIGSRSAVDQYQQSATRPSSALPSATFGAIYPHNDLPTTVVSTAAADGSGGVRQVTLMQPQLPAAQPSQYGLPPIGSTAPAGTQPLSMPPPPATQQPFTGQQPYSAQPPVTSQPPAMGTNGMSPVPRAPAGGNLQPGSAYSGSGFSGGNSDLTPLTQPQLGNSFASLGNCRNISAPSSYRSDRILTCGPPAGYVMPTSNSQVYVPPPAQIGTTAGVLPPAMAAPIGFTPVPGTTQTVIPGNAGYRPLLSFGQERYPVQIGQGIFGQPVAYVPGQSFRNAMRYIAW